MFNVPLYITGVKTDQSPKEHFQFKVSPCQTHPTEWKWQLSLSDWYHFHQAALKTEAKQLQLHGLEAGTSFKLPCMDILCCRGGMALLFDRNVDK